MPRTTPRGRPLPPQIAEALLPLEHVLRYIEQTNSDDGVSGLAHTSTNRVLEWRTGGNAGLHIHNNSEVQTYNADGRTYSRVAPTRASMEVTRLNITNIRSGDRLFVARINLITRREVQIYNDIIAPSNDVQIITMQLNSDWVGAEFIVRVGNADSINPIIPFEHSFILEEGLNEVTTTRRRDTLGIVDPHVDQREPFFNGTIYFSSESSYNGIALPSGERETPVNNIDSLIQICNNHTTIHRIEVVGGDYYHDLIATTELSDYEIIDSRPTMQMNPDGTFVIRGDINPPPNRLVVYIDRTMDSYQLYRKLNDIKITDKNKFALADLIVRKTVLPKKQLVKTKRRIRLNNDINERKQD